MPQWTREQLEQIIKERKKNFRGLNLSGADFTGLNLDGADFRSARCPYVKFTNCSCRFANFEGAELTFSQWDGADLHRVNFKEASLCDADMRGVKDFFGVTMTMECRTWKGLKLDPGFWFGFIFYGFLMEPPSEEAKEKLVLFFGNERYDTLRRLYTTRQI